MIMMVMIVIIVSLFCPKAYLVLKNCSVLACELKSGVCVLINNKTAEAHLSKY